jgi:outer membrane lipopolysaccharide assembly protein LptE/RlpB
MSEKAIGRTGVLAVLLGALALGAMAISAAGCGYGLVGRGSNLPQDIRAVYIKPLENRTPRAQVEQFLTRAIADEMVTRKRFAVVGSEGEANAELTGSVVAFGATPVTFDASGRATEYEISITAQMAFRRVGQQDAIWQNDNYTFRESYPVEVSGSEYIDREDEAIERAAERFAETMVSDLLEGF